MRSLVAFIGLLLNIAYRIIENAVLTLMPRKFRRAKDVRGQLVLVTGAGGAIGRQLALGFAQLGCRIVCWDIAKQANEETAKLVQASGGEAFAYQVDLRKRGNVYQKAAIVKQELGPVTILVNNAGIVFPKDDFLQTSDEQIETTFQVNALAHFWTVKAFLQGMIDERKGHIVTVSSVLGLFGCNQVIDYSSSKFAAHGFTESLKIEFEVNGLGYLKTTVVFPYMVRTPMTKDVYSPLLETLPFLETDYVARRITEAVSYEESFLVLPRIFTVLVILNQILPEKAMTAIGHYLTGSEGVCKLAHK